MKQIAAIVFFFFLFGTTDALAQTTPEGLVVEISDSTKTEAIDPLIPSKAAFYSAVLPGLGQAYNKKYWKIPLAYIGIGVAVYSYSWNNTKYHDYRDAYKRRLAGFEDDQFYNILDNDRLIRAQRFHQRNRDLSLLAAVAVYALNIIDANIDAHLMQFNVNENLSVAPQVYQNEFNFKPNLAFSVNYKF